MLFMISWKIEPENTEAAISRFKQAGAPPPQGVKMHGRWFRVGKGVGFAIAETDDPIRLEKWSQEWSDLFLMDITPAITDEQMAQAMQ